jgi:hypothetical protein
MAEHQTIPPAPARLLCLLEGGLASTADDNLIALLREALCQRQTDAGCAAGDKNRVSCEIQGRASFQELGRCADDKGQPADTRSRPASRSGCRGYPRVELPFDGRRPGYHPVSTRSTGRF